MQRKSANVLKETNKILICMTTYKTLHMCREIKHNYGIYLTVFATIEKCLLANSMDIC